MLTLGEVIVDEEDGEGVEAVPTPTSFLLSCPACTLEVVVQVLTPGEVLVDEEDGEGVEAEPIPTSLLFSSEEVVEGEELATVEHPGGVVTIVVEELVPPKFHKAIQQRRQSSRLGRPGADQSTGTSPALCSHSSQSPHCCNDQRGCERPCPPAPSAGVGDDPASSAGVCDDPEGGEEEVGTTCPMLRALPEGRWSERPFLKLPGALAPTGGPYFTSTTPLPAFF